MRRVPKLLALLTLVFFWGCSNTILVPVPPRMDLKKYGTIGLVHFATNSDPALTAFATQQFQEHVQGAFPGTPILDLGTKEAVLAAIGTTQLDADAMTLIGKKYGVSAVFLGEIVYSDPKTDVTVNDLTSLNGSIRTEIRGDVSGKLMETQVVPACGAALPGRSANSLASACHQSEECAPPSETQILARRWCLHSCFI
jgi:hypothetical protein